ncbi:MAG: MFS transporter [Bradyrhizobiaceae bacterium]|nr:MAG: MFS transporter [Bradyrhizobiaceae bacterium]
MEKDSTRSWLIVVTLGFAVAIAAMDRVVLSVATPTIMKDLHLSGTNAGLLLAAFFWSYTLMQLPSGMLVDRFGAKKVLGIGFALWSLSCAATGLASSLAGLIAFRLGLGVGEGPVFPSAYRLVSTVFSERNRGLASAIYGDGSKLGPAIGAPLAGILIVSYGWQSMFAIVGLVSLLWLIPWFIIAPSQKEDVGTVKNRINWSEFWALLKKRDILGAAVGYFGYLYIFYVYITWLPGYLVLERGFSTLQAGWLSMVPFAVQFTVAPIAGYFTDSFIHKGYSTTTVRKTAIGIGLILAFSIVPAALVNSSTACLFFFALSTAGLGICNPNMLAVPSGLAPKNRGGIVGAIQNTGGNLGGVVAPMVTGATYDATHSFVVALAIAGSMLFVCALGYLLMIRRIEPVDLRSDEVTALAASNA